MITIDLPKLNDTPLIPYVKSGVQIYHLVEWIIAQIGPVSITATTFSVAEEFLRAMFRLKKEGKVTELNILCDLKAAQKTMKINELMRNVCDNVFMGENHSKIVLLQSENARVAIVTSQNQTRGNRYEGGIITSDEEVYDVLYYQVSEIIATKSIVWRKGQPLPQSMKV